jgi:hypothetical protein
MPEYFFTFGVPLGKELIHLNDKWSEIPRPDYKYYCSCSYLNTHTLMAMLFDKHYGGNSNSHKLNTDTFELTFADVEQFLVQAIKVGELEILNYQDLMISWGAEIPFCCVELSINDVSKWLSNKDIVQKIESNGIEVAEEFKRLIKDSKSNDESVPFQKEKGEGGAQKGVKAPPIREAVQEEARRLKKHSTIYIKDIPYRASITSLIAPKKTHLKGEDITSEKYHAHYGRKYSTIYKWVSDGLKKSENS